MSQRVLKMHVLREEVERAFDGSQLMLRRGCRVNEGPRMVNQVVDYCTGSADTSPAYSHCFPECIDADADAVVQPFFHGNAGAPGSPYARAVRFVKHDRETELRGERRELLQRAFVSIHGVDGFDRHVYS